MIGTEKEFAKKRCTISLVLLAVPDPEDRSGMLASGQTKCIGSACAQWHWYDYADNEGNTHFAAGVSRFTRGKLSASSSDSHVDKVPARGYCGMTGTRE